MGSGVPAVRTRLDNANLATFLALRRVEETPLLDGSSFSWEFCDPNRLLAHMVSESPRLQELFLQGALKHPCSMEEPWSLVLGFDEFAPGNKMKVQSHRKCMNLSFTFLELGRDALWHEAIWMTPVCVRSGMLAKVIGGRSHMLRRYLRLQLLGDNGLATAGVPLVLNGHNLLLYAKLSHVLGDGDGLRMCWDWKGANGLKPCFKHLNVVSKGSDIATRDPNFVEITCDNPSQFRDTTQADVFAAADVLPEARQRVAEGAMTKAHFKELEKAYGLSAAPEGVPADAELRLHVDPALATTFD